ncbi:hypothetical protein [Rubneribacter sp.]|nr:hypothetical protein [Candidatus Rubneribacter avistercoris]
MTDAILQFPKPGTKLTYCDATAAYDNLEDRLLGRAYGPALRPAAEMHDLLWELEALSDKFGIADDGRLASLRRRVHEFTVERTTLANGAHGERFFLRNDASRLAQHDDSGIFEVGVDGEKLLADFDAFIAVLQKEADGTDEYADTYSPSRPIKVIRRPGRSDLASKWLAVGFVFLMTCLGISMVAHLVMQASLYSSLMA